MPRNVVPPQLLGLPSRLLLLLLLSVPRGGDRKRVLRSSPQRQAIGGCSLQLGYLIGYRVELAGLAIQLALRAHPEHFLQVLCTSNPRVVLRTRKLECVRMWMRWPIMSVDEKNDPGSYHN